MMWRDFVKNWDIKLLSLVLAMIVWAGVTGKRTAEMDLTVSFEVSNLAPGFTIAGPVPRKALVTVTGPRILLLKLRSEKIIIPLDVRGIEEGTALFTGFERNLRLPSEVEIVRLFPSSVELRLIRSSTIHKPQ